MYLHDLKDGKITTSSSGICTIQVNNTQLSHSWVLDIGCGFHICFDFQGLRESEDVEHGKLIMIMGNGQSSPITKIGMYGLMLTSSVRVNLTN